MTAYVALLRAINVGGTGKLSMATLKALCAIAGFRQVGTYIASGNVVFSSDLAPVEVKQRLEAILQSNMGSNTRVLVRTADEIAAVFQANPFSKSPGNRVVSIFLDEVVTLGVLEGITGQGENEEIRLGRREIYVRYDETMGRSRLRISAADAGTARNMNTVGKLAVLSAALNV